MSSGMFRGKESSNRIELSRLVQDLLNFGVSGSLWLWGWGWVDGGRGWVDGVGGDWGVPPTHVHTHAHAHMHTHTHARVVNMIISCKWPPLLGEYLGIPMMSYMHVCACVCMHVCACTHGWDAPSHHPPSPSTHPLPPRVGDPRNHSKFNST